MAEEVVVPPKEGRRNAPANEGYDAFSNVFNEITARRSTTRRRTR